MIHFPEIPRKHGDELKQKQDPLVLAHAITIHKSQESTVDYTVGDLDCAIDKGPNAAVVNKSQFQTLLSRVKSCDKVKLLNFDLSHIRCNEHALAEMEQVKHKSNNCLFDWQYPLSILYGNKIYLFNTAACYVSQKHS